MKIGELAKIIGCATETIRFYEKIGLIPPADRSENNYRQYNKKHLERLMFIRNCRSLEMNHDEIQTLIIIMDNPNNQVDHHSAHSLIVNHLRHIDERIDELKSLRQELVKLQSHCQSSNLSCGILQELTEMPVVTKPVKSHV